PRQVPSRDPVLDVRPRVARRRARVLARLPAGEEHRVTRPASRASARVDKPDVCPDNTVHEPRTERHGMDLELNDKVAIVGGASKGLGRACAEVLAQEGVKVALCSRSQPDLEKAAKEIRDATRG